MKKYEWSTEWPTEPGFYWFYGWPYKKEKERGIKPELNSIKVSKISNGVMITRSGAFWFREEWGGEGKFISAKMPALPDIEEAK